MHYSTRSFLGQPSETSWSQYWENEPDDPALRASHGHLFGIINLQVDDGQNPSDLGHQIIQEINQLYYSSPANLESVLEAVTNNSLYQFTSLTLVLAVVHNNSLHLATYNPGVVIFQRDSKISPILKGLTAQILTLSGPLRPEDRFLLTTQSFFEQYQWDRIKTFLSSGKIQDVEENFMSLLYSLESQNTLAAAIIQVHSDEIQDITPLATENTDVLPSLSREGGPPAGGPGGFFRKLFKNKPIQISHHESAISSRRHKLNIAFALILLLILGISIYFGSVRNRATRLENQYQSLKSQYTVKFDNATAIKNINLKEAQSLAAEADKILSQMSALSLHSDEVSGFQATVRSLLSQTGSSEAYQPEQFYDTTLISSAKYNQSFLQKNQLYLFDSVTGRLDQIDVSKKSQQNIITSTDLQGSQSLAVDNGVVYLLKGQQIFEIKNKTSTSKIDLTKQIDSLTSGQIHLWNGNLYLLAFTASTEPTIWKFAPNSTGFSPGAVWLKSGQPLPADPSAFAINGSVWVLSKTGQVSSYTLGLKDKINIKSTFDFTAATNLVTAPDIDILAFSNNNLVYINRKTGDAVSSYNFGNKNILSLSLDSASKALFVLCDDQKIYKINL